MSTDIAQRVNFTRLQVEYLNKMYPEVVGNATTTEAEMRYRQGQRSVIAFLMTRTAEQSPGE